MQNYADKSKKIENKLTEKKKKKQISTNNNIKNNTESLLMEKTKDFVFLLINV